MKYKMISAIFVIGLLLSIATEPLEAQAKPNRASKDQSTTQANRARRKKKGIVRRTAGEVDKGAKDVGKGGEKGAAAVAEGAEDVAKGTAVGAKDASKGLARVTRKTGRATARAAKKVGRAFK